MNMDSRISQAIQISDNFNFPRIYVTDAPWHNSPPTTFWSGLWASPMKYFVLAIGLLLMSSVCCSLICKKRRSRMQSSNSNLMETRTTSGCHCPCRLPADTPAVHSRLPGHINGRGMDNYAFTSSIQNPVPISYNDDKPPEYSTVVNDKQEQTRNSCAINETQWPIETSFTSYSDRGSYSNNNL